MDGKTLESLRLPTPEQAQAPARRRDRVHFMMETPDGEGLSVGESELSAFLQRYGSPAGTRSGSGSLPDSGSRP